MQSNFSADMPCMLISTPCVVACNGDKKKKCCKKYKKKGNSNCKRCPKI